MAVLHFTQSMIWCQVFCREGVKIQCLGMSLYLWHSEWTVSNLYVIWMHHAVKEMHHFNHGYEQKYWMNPYIDFNEGWTYLISGSRESKTMFFCCDKTHLLFLKISQMEFQFIILGLLCFAEVLQNLWEDMNMTTHDWYDFRSKWYQPHILCRNKKTWKALNRTVIIIMFCIFDIPDVKNYTDNWKLSNQKFEWLCMSRNVTYNKINKKYIEALTLCFNLLFTDVVSNEGQLN